MYMYYIFLKTALYYSSYTDLKFFLVPIHTKPNITAKEIDALPEAFKKAAEVFGTQTGVILGDLNCGCEYMSKKRYKKLRLVNDPSFYWWIKNDADTTTKRNHSCPFDRCVSKQASTIIMTYYYYAST